MKAIELIKELQKLNPEAEVTVEFLNGLPTISEVQDEAAQSSAQIGSCRHSFKHNRNNFWERLFKNQMVDDDLESKIQELYDSMGAENNEAGQFQRAL